MCENGWNYTWIYVLDNIIMTMFGSKVVALNKSNNGMK
jgi:hypothetical protein